MKANYKPFTTKKIIETDHGIINKEKNRYFTHRRPEHYFKKYQGFGISTTEIEIAKNEGCTHIIIKYHGRKKNILYKIKMNYLQYMKKYDFNGDEQIILPEKEMTIIGTEEGLEEHQ